MALPQLLFCCSSERDALPTPPTKRSQHGKQVGTLPRRTKGGGKAGRAEGVEGKGERGAVDQRRGLTTDRGAETQAVTVWSGRVSLDISVLRKELVHVVQYNLTEAAAFLGLIRQHSFHHILAKNL